MESRHGKRREGLSLSPSVVRGRLTLERDRRLGRALLIDLLTGRRRWEECGEPERRESRGAASGCGSGAVPGVGEVPTGRASGAGRDRSPAGPVAQWPAVRALRGGGSAGAGVGRARQLLPSGRPPRRGCGGLRALVRVGEKGHGLAARPGAPGPTLFGAAVRSNGSTPRRRSCSSER